MNFENILTVLLSATIPSIITYLVTRKTCDSKIIQIKISKDSEINHLKLQHQHEIDKLESEHKHNIEKLEFQHQLEKDSKSDDATSDLAMKFFNGELNLENTINNISKLDDLQKEMDHLAKKQSMQNFIKKNKSAKAIAFIPSFITCNKIGFSIINDSSLEILESICKCSSKIFFISSFSITSSFFSSAPFVL